MTVEARAKKALDVDSPLPEVGLCKDEAELRGRRRSDGELEASMEEKRATMSCAAHAQPLSLNEERWSGSKGTVRDALHSNSRQQQRLVHQLSGCCIPRV